LERAELVLQRLQFARRSRPGVEPRLVLEFAGTYLVHVTLDPRDVPVEVVDADLRPYALVVERGDLLAEPLDLGEVGQRTPPVRQLGQRGVDCLELEQPALGLGIRLHWAGLLSATVHGSVSRSETTAVTSRTGRR